MDKMRELVQQSASSSTELSAAAEQMLKLSRNLLDSMDRFVLGNAANHPRPQRESSSRRGRDTQRNQELETPNSRVPEGSRIHTWKKNSR